MVAATRTTKSKKGAKGLHFERKPFTPASVRVHTGSDKEFRCIGEGGVCLTGRPGIGKSTFVRYFPEPMFIASDQAQHKHIEGVPIVVPESWDEVLGILDFLEGERRYKGKPIQTVAFDLVDQFYYMVLEAVSGQAGYDYPPQDHGRTWHQVRAQWQMFLMRLMRIPNLNKFFVGHVAEKEVQLSQDIRKTLLTPQGLDGKISTFLLDIVNDSWVICYGKGFMVPDSGDVDETKANVITHNTYRITHAKHKLARLPESFPFNPADIPDSYKRFKALCLEHNVTFAGWEK